MHDAPDAAAVVAFVEFAFGNLLGEPGDDEDDVLDDAVIHVGEIESAVGADAGVHGAEALVGAGDEFLLGREEACGVRLRAAIEFQGADEVAGGVGHEDVAAHLGRKLIAIVEAGAGDDSVGAQAAVIAQFERTERDGGRDADGKTFCGILGDVHIDAEAAATTALREFGEVWVTHDGLGR